MNFGTEIPDDDIARAGLLDRASVPWHVALGETASNTFVHNPLPEAFSSMELAMANNPILRGAFGGGADAPMQAAPEDQSDGAADQFVDPKTLNAQYGQSLGLTFDQPTRQGAVAIMVRRKQEERQRQSYIDRAPGGLAYGAASLATQLAVSATDPLNVASAFIPVVPEARAAIWAEKYGKLAARAATGAVEGSVGAAAIEPVNYAASKYLGDDYDMADSIMNIALGGILGGGLHVGFGAFSDHMARMSPETREGALRGAIANMAEGRPVDVEHIIAADPKVQDGIPRTEDVVAHDQAIDAGQHAVPAPEKAGPPGVAGLRVLGEEDLRKAARDIAPDLFSARDEIRTKQETYRRWLGELQDTHQVNVEAAAPHGKTIPSLQERIETATVRNAKKLQARLDTLSGERAAFISEKTKGDSADMARVREQLQAEDLKLRDMGPQIKDAYDQARTRLNAEIERPVAARQAASLDRARTASMEYSKGAEPSPAVPPPEASARADTLVREAHGGDIEAEHAEALAQVDAFEKQGALTPSEAEQARTGADDIKRANQEGKAAKAAARCLLLHP